MFLECNSMSWQHHFPFEQCTDFDPDFAFVLAQSIFVPIRSIRQDGRGAIFASQNSSCFVRFATRIDLWAFDSSLHPTVATASNLLCWQRSCLLPTMETRSEESQFEWSSHDNASLMSPGRAYHVPPPPDGDSNDSETDEVPSLTHSTPFDSADTGPCSSPIWTCVECKNTNWNWMAAGWRCSRCGCEKFYDACHYGDSNDSGGTWIFVPHEAADHDRHSMERKPDDPGAPSSVGERAESEAMTQDPTVDPDTLRPLSRRQRKAHRRAAEERAQLNSATSPNPKTLLTSLPQTAPKASSNASNAWTEPKDAFDFFASDCTEGEFKHLQCMARWHATRLESGCCRQAWQGQGLDHSEGPQSGRQIPRGNTPESTPLDLRPRWSEGISEVGQEAWGVAHPDSVIPTT